jgi:2-iminobutanoate/2-iminopropanoate deaminase
MSFKAFEPEGYAPPSVPYSSVVVSGDLVATAGQVPLTPEGMLVSEDFREQTEQVFLNLEATLAAAGCTLGDVFKVNGYLTSFDDFPIYNEIYTRHFAAPFPARATIQAGLYGIKVEVEAWARVPQG